MRKLLGGAVLSTMLCGGCQSAAKVECIGSADGYNCTVTHVEGSAVEVCWDVVTTCQNGTKTKAHGCQRVTPGQVSSRLIPRKDIQGLDACDKALSEGIENIVLTIQ